MTFNMPLLSVVLREVSLSIIKSRINFLRLFSLQNLIYDQRRQMERPKPRSFGPGANAKMQLRRHGRRSINYPPFIGADLIGSALLFLFRLKFF